MIKKTGKSRSLKILYLYSILSAGRLRPLLYMQCSGAVLDQEIQKPSQPAVGQTFQAESFFITRPNMKDIPYHEQVLPADTGNIIVHHVSAPDFIIADCNPQKQPICRRNHCAIEFIPAIMFVLNRANQFRTDDFVLKKFYILKALKSPMHLPSPLIVSVYFPLYPLH